MIVDTLATIDQEVIRIIMKKKVLPKSTNIIIMMIITKVPSIFMKKITRIIRVDIPDMAMKMVT